MSSIKTQISQALITKLADVTALKYRAFDTIKLQSSDFQEWELPAVQIIDLGEQNIHEVRHCLLYTSPSPRDRTRSRMPSSA